MGAELLVTGTDEPALELAAGAEDEEAGLLATLQPYPLQTETDVACAEVAGAEVAGLLVPLV